MSIPVEMVKIHKCLHKYLIEMDSQGVTYQYVNKTTRVEQWACQGHVRICGMPVIGETELLNVISVSLVVMNSYQGHLYCSDNYVYYVTPYL